MRVLFGPACDHRHTPDPAPSGAYEWWYFDALSDDGRFALVVIFFLGSPMSPYYKRVVDGLNPDPLDWCGVSVTLHEKVGEQRWRERAYAYNLYRNGRFASDRVAVSLGGSSLSFDGQGTWTLGVSERGLWRGRVRAELSFTLDGPPLTAPASGPDDDAHSWVCVAPACRVSGTVTPTSGTAVAFAGDGYHDHNFGTLPMSHIQQWYWGRVMFSAAPTNPLLPRGAIYYHVEGETPPAGETLLVRLRHDGSVQLSRAAVFVPEVRADAGFGGLARWAMFAVWDAAVIDGLQSLQVALRADPLTMGPFYCRYPVDVTVNEDTSTEYSGIGEVFQPSRLLGPIASRAMWSRIRRRSAP